MTVATAVPYETVWLLAVMVKITLLIVNAVELELAAL